MRIHIPSFQGMAPKMAAHMLPDSASQIASNVRLTAGSLRALNAPSQVVLNLAPAAKAVHMFGPPGGTSTLSWTVDTDVARSPIADSEYRIYYTNGTIAKKTSLALAGLTGPAPNTEYLMGTPAPSAAPTLASAGAGSYTETRVYVVTHLTTFGSVVEESAPSPPVTITLSSSSGVNLTNIPQPATLVGRNYTGIRIYRTTGTTFQLVNATPLVVGVTSYTDNLSSTGIAGDALLTTGWLPPANDLQGLCSLPSGTMAAFRNNEIWFCEPNYPHAWPVKYMQALDTTIVAIRAFGNNIAVATQGNPFVGSGVSPDSFTFQRIPRTEPCVSKRSMAGDELGAIYASQSGLVSLGLDGDSLATSEVFTRAEFLTYAPSSIIGGVFENRYYGFYDTGLESGTLIFGRREQTGLRTLTLTATAVCLEPVTAQLLYVNKVDNKLYSMDPLGTLPLTYYWKSKLFNMPYPVNLGYLQVHSAESSVATIAYNIQVAAANVAINSANSATFAAGDLLSAMNTSALGAMTMNGSTLTPLIATIKSTVAAYVWAGGNLVFSGELNFNTIYTLPSGFKSIGWEIALAGQQEVSSVELTTSTGEMQQ